MLLCVDPPPETRVATKWVSGYFAKYEIGRKKTFFSRNFGGIPRNSAEGFCQNFAYFREILMLFLRNFPEFCGIISNFYILVTNFYNFHNFYQKKVLVLVK